MFHEENSHWIPAMDEDSHNHAAFETVPRRKEPRLHGQQQLLLQGKLGGSPC